MVSATKASPRLYNVCASISMFLAQQVGAAPPGRPTTTSRRVVHRVADVAMDFVEGFPRINGNLVILTYVDRFSKYGHFIPMGHPYTATTVVKAFFDTIVRLHGIPCSVVSNQDPVFSSHFWWELFRLVDVKLQLSSAFHPQSVASPRRQTR
jgi:hypothetical protein